MSLVLRHTIDQSYPLLSKTEDGYLKSKARRYTSDSIGSQQNHIYERALRPNDKWFQHQIVIWRWDHSKQVKHLASLLTALQPGLQLRWAVSQNSRFDWIKLFGKILKRNGKVRHFFFVLVWTNRVIVRLRNINWNIVGFPSSLLVSQLEKRSLLSNSAAEV